MWLVLSGGRDCRQAAWVAQASLVIETCAVHASSRPRTGASAGSWPQQVEGSALAISDGESGAERDCRQAGTSYQSRRLVYGWTIGVLTYRSRESSRSVEALCPFRGRCSVGTPVCSSLGSGSCGSRCPRQTRRRPPTAGTSHLPRPRLGLRRAHPRRLASSSPSRERPERRRRRDVPRRSGS